MNCKSQITLLLRSTFPHFPRVHSIIPATNAALTQNQPEMAPEMAPEIGVCHRWLADFTSLVSIKPNGGTPFVFWWKLCCGFPEVAPNYKSTYLIRIRYLAVYYYLTIMEDHFNLKQNILRRYMRALANRQAQTFTRVLKFKCRMTWCSLAFLISVHWPVAALRIRNRNQVVNFLAY
jgi:hypothetical protein